VLDIDYKTQKVIK